MCVCWFRVSHLNDTERNETRRDAKYGGETQTQTSGTRGPARGDTHDPRLTALRAGLYSSVDSYLQSKLFVFSIKERELAW